MLIVYFSSTTENTHHFVHKLGLPSARIPIKKTDGPLTVTKPYVLICPTYGGGVSIHGDNLALSPSRSFASLMTPPTGHLFAELSPAATPTSAPTTAPPGTSSPINATSPTSTVLNSWATTKM